MSAVIQSLLPGHRYPETDGSTSAHSGAGGEGGVLLGVDGEGEGEGVPALKDAEPPVPLFEHFLVIGVPVDVSSDDDVVSLQH